MYSKDKWLSEKTAESTEEKREVHPKIPLGSRPPKGRKANLHTGQEINIATFAFNSHYFRHTQQELIHQQ